MAELAGINGKLVINAATVASLQGWKIDVDFGTIDTTKLGGDGWKTSMNGLKGWSGSADGQFVISTDTNGQAAIQTAAFAGTPVALKFYPDATHYYGGSAVVKTIAIDDSVADAVKITFTFEGNGALAYN